MKEKVKIKKKFATFLLIYFVIFTLYFSLITLSKYIGMISESTSTTIAKWEVLADTSDNDSDTLYLVNGNGTQNYILKVTSNSDVAANYSVILSNLPSEIQVKIDNGTYKTPLDDNTITFDNVGTINANDGDYEYTHQIIFNVPLESETVGISEIDIDVKFVQVNPQ